MKVGVGMFVTGYTVDAVTLARRVEEGGFSSIWVPDHTVLPVGPETKYPSTGGEIPTLYGEMADPFVLLSFIGAVTTKLRLATGITLVPERHPLTLAKTVSTLDNFSNGRVILGIGTGWLKEETELYGTDFDTRWQYTREAVLAMKGLWRDGTAAYDGKYVSFPEVRCDPLPAQRPHPPVIIGAPGSDTTVKRIVGWGDGWLPVMPTPEEVCSRAQSDQRTLPRGGAQPGRNRDPRLRDGRYAGDAAGVRGCWRGRDRDRYLQPPRDAAAVRAVGTTARSRPPGPAAGGRGDARGARKDPRPGATLGRAARQRRKNSVCNSSITPLRSGSPSSA